MKSTAEGWIKVDRVVDAINSLDCAVVCVNLRDIKAALSEHEPDVAWIITADGHLDSAGGSSRYR